MLTIGAIARQAGVRPSALRYYEVKGILTPSGRLPNGYRMYDGKAVASLRLIRRAQALGLTLGEIKEILNLARQGEEPCCRVKELVRDHPHEIGQKIQDLQVLRGQLQALLRQKPHLSFTGQLCPMLESEIEPLHQA